jgi:uncharacterized damage-inducible protein DinB
MDADYFRALFGHTYWARDKILDQVAALTHEEYTAARPLDYGSIRATLVHNLSAEAGYLARLQGRQLETPINEETLPTFDALRERWNAEQENAQSFLANLTDADLTRQFEQVSARTGEKTINPVWWLLAQCLNHSTQHRSEVALTITQLGHSPGDLDVIRFLRAQSA